MPIVNQSISNKILNLMKVGSDVIGLQLIFHDRLDRSGLPEKWRFHRNEACKNMNKETVSVCHQFCMIEVHDALKGKPEGRVHTCPFGLTEIVVPVYTSGQYAGILFAGVIWNSDEQPPTKNIIQISDQKWFSNRKIMLKCIATELGILLEGDQFYIPSDRRKIILEYIQLNMENEITIEDIAKEINLSSSRMGHIIKEIFSATFPQLVRSVKMIHASHLLLSTELKQSEISRMVGIQDSNYFSYQFKKEMGVSPMAYRKKYKWDA